MLTSWIRNLAPTARVRTLVRSPSQDEPSQKAEFHTAAQRALAIPEIRKLIQDELTGPDFLRSKRIDRAWNGSAQSAGMHRAQLRAAMPPCRAPEPMPFDLKVLQTALVDELTLQNNLQAGRSVESSNWHATPPHKMKLSANPNFLTSASSTERVLAMRMRDLEATLRYVGLPTSVAGSLLLTHVDAAFGTAYEYALAAGLSRDQAHQLGYHTLRAAIVHDIGQRNVRELWEVARTRSGPAIQEFLTRVTSSGDGTRAVGISSRHEELIHIELTAPNPYWKSVSSPEGLVLLEPMIAPDGKTALVVAEDGVYRCDLTAKLPKLTRMAGSPDSTSWVYYTRPNESSLFEVDDGDGPHFMTLELSGTEPKIIKFDVDATDCYDAQLLAGGQLLIWKEDTEVSGEDTPHVCFDVTTRECTPLYLERDLSRHADVSHDRQWFAQATAMNIALYHARSRTTVDLVSTRGGRVTCLEFSPDNKYVAAALSQENSVDAMIRLWELDPTSHSAKLCDAFMGSKFKFSPDGNYLLAAGADSVSLWDLSREQRKEIKLATTHGRFGAVTCVDFSPDGRQVAVAFQSGEVFSLDFAMRRVSGFNLSELFEQYKLTQD